MMKTTRSFAFASSFCFALFAAAGCEEAAPPSEPVVMPTWETELAGDKPLGELTQEEIGPACEELVAVLDGADELLACHVVAVGEMEDAATCEASLSDCLDEPGDVVDSLDLRAAPEPIDCDLFTVEAAAGCTRTVAELEECINLISASLEPSAEAMTCENAADWDLDKANLEARRAQDVMGYTAACKPLEDCADLVAVLLGED